MAVQNSANHNEDSSIHKHNCSMPKPLGLVVTMTSSMLSFQLGRAVIARSGRHLAIWVACGTATRQHSPEPSRTIPNPTLQTRLKWLKLTICWLLRNLGAVPGASTLHASRWNENWRLRRSRIKSNEFAWQCSSVSIPCQGCQTTKTWTRASTSIGGTWAAPRLEWQGAARYLLISNEATWTCTAKGTWK